MPTLSTWLLHRTKAALGLGLGLMLAVAIPVAWAWDWSPHIVDDNNHVRGQFCDLKVDLDGRHHAAYYRWDPFGEGSRNPVYSTHPDPVAGGSWSTTIIDSQPSTGTETSIALDKDGNPHVTYYESEFANLKHAWNDGGGWQNEFVDMAGAVGQFSAVWVDFSGTVSVAYYDASYPGLKFAQKPSGGSWQHSYIDTSGTVGLYVSMVQGAGPLHVAYYDLTKRNLRHAELTGSGWVSTTVDSIGDVGRYTSITTNTQGQPSIAYYDVFNGDLKLAERGAGNVWTVTTVDSPGDVGAETSIALRDGSRPHITYYDRDSQDLLIAARTLSGGWVFDQVATADDVGSYSSLATVGDFPHVVYFNGTQDRLDFASGTGSVVGVGDEPEPAPLRLSLTALANPMRPPGAFALSSPEPGAVRVRVFDVTGRQVRELLRGESSSEVRNITWDGRDAFGRQVAAGRYLVSAESQKSKATIGLVVIH